jgi:hypothetical protein
MKIEECQLLAAAYCSEHPTDEGCHHLLMSFERTIGKETTVLFHLPEVVGSAVTVTLLPGPCECGACSPTYTLDTFVASSSGVVTFPFTPKTLGMYKICAAGSATEVHVGNVHVLLDTCAFEGTQDSPCFAGACADAEDSVECMQKVTEYCMTHVDEACALLVYRFAGEVGAPLTITLHTASPDAPLKVVAAAHDCSDGPATNGVDVLRTRGTDLLIVDILPVAGGSYKLCLLEAHPAQAHLATIDVATLSCAYELAEPNPCTSIRVKIRRAKHALISRPSIALSTPRIKVACVSSPSSRVWSEYRRAYRSRSRRSKRSSPRCGFRQAALVGKSAQPAPK